MTSKPRTSHLALCFCITVPDLYYSDDEAEPIRTELTEKLHRALPSSSALDGCVVYHKTMGAPEKFECVLIDIDTEYGDINKCVHAFVVIKYTFCGTLSPDVSAISRIITNEMADVKVYNDTMRTANASICTWIPKMKDILSRRDIAMVPGLRLVRTSLTAKPLSPPIAITTIASTPAITLPAIKPVTPATASIVKKKPVTIVTKRDETGTVIKVVKHYTEPIAVKKVRVKASAKPASKTSSPDVSVTPVVTVVPAAEPQKRIRQSFFG